MTSEVREVLTNLGEVWESRRKNCQYSGKKGIALQHEFYMGASAVINLLGIDHIDPIVIFGVMRGEDLTQEFEKYKES